MKQLKCHLQSVNIVFFIVFLCCLNLIAVINGDKAELERRLMRRLELPVSLSKPY